MRQLTARPAGVLCNGAALCDGKPGARLLWRDSQPLRPFGHDALNRVDTAKAHYIPGGDRLLDSAYDGSGNRTDLDVTTLLAAGGTADLLSHEWRYDERNRLIEAVFPGGADPTLEIEYWASDDLRVITHGNGATTNYLYHAHGPVDSIKVADTASTQLHKLVYGYDGVLNVDSIGESIGTTAATPAYAYGYDAQQRLISATYPGLPGLPASESFPYDAASNRDDNPNADSPWRYDANNRIENSPAPNSATGTREYGFDLDGNLLTVTQANTPPLLPSARVMTFDWSNRLKRVDEGVVPIVAYEYDPFGRRIRKVVTQTGIPLNEVTYYLWDGDRLLAEYSDTGARRVRYAYAESFAPAQVAYGPAGAETIYDVHSDHLDTPRMLTNAAGIPKWRAAYRAFGEAALDPANTVTFNLRFPGQYFDAETGWHDNRHRVYDPTVGRYISADPVGQYGAFDMEEVSRGTSANLYEYAQNDPIGLVDPLGLYVLAAPSNPANNWTAAATSIAANTPTLPQSFVNFSAGAGDALLLGAGSYLRGATGAGGFVNQCSTAYSVGSYAALAAGVARLGYAVAAKAGAAAAATGVAAHAFRNSLKVGFRLGIAKGYRSFPYSKALQKYGSPAAVKAAAGRTNPGINAYGAGVAAAGAAGAAGCGCPQ